MAMYGLQADVEQNKGRNVNLYVPGKTQLSAQDVFLGGPATGVTDAMIGPATRVFGNDRKGTEIALNEYNNDLSSQINAAIAQNAAPRADASRGTPSLARQAQEIQQAQGNITNQMNSAQLTGSYNNAPTLAQKTFEHGVSQDVFSNDMARQAQSIQGAQFNANLAQNESQFGRTLSSGNFNDAANRALSFQKASMPTAAEIDDANKADAYGDVDRAIAVGTDWGTIRQEIMNNASRYPTGVSYTQVLAYAEAKYNTSVASSKAYPTSQQGVQQSADALTSSAFRNWSR